MVGGSVRDALLGRPEKDLDVEVHGLEVASLLPLLRRLGSVNEVGRSFGVFKVRLPGAGGEIDVSVPRRDSKRGPGHRGIEATADPHLGVHRAARRRDLTINAIAWDPLTGAFEDPFEGRRDLADRRLRAVDRETFGEDPLRALRVAQFAGRFAFEVDAELEELCATMPLAELPAERIRGEVEKLLLRSPHPSLGWRFAHRTGMWAKVLPEWASVPEGLDRCAGVKGLDGSRRLALLLGAACEGLDPEATTRVLDRLWIHRVEGYPLRAQVLFEVEARRRLRPGADATDLRTLAEGGQVDLLCHLVDRPDLLTLAATLGCATQPLPVLLQGRDLKPLGVKPGPRMGALLEALRAAQLRGEVSSPGEARGWIARRMEDDAPA